MPGAVAQGPPPNNLPAEQAARLWKSAQDFEAMATNELLAPMFDTVDTAHSAFGGGSAEAAWKPMLVQQVARSMEARGGLGLAVPVFNALLQTQEGRLNGR